MNLDFRTAKSNDASAIVELVNSAYRGDSSRAGWTTEADLLDGQRTDQEAILELIQRPHSYMLLCLEKDKLLACVHLEKQDNKCYLGMLTVRPKLQNAGVGRKLLQQAENFANTTIHSQKIYMTVISVRTELISWYERRGYINLHQTQPFPYGNPRFGLPKKQNLVFTVLEKTLSY